MYNWTVGQLKVLHGLPPGSILKDAADPISTSIYCTTYTLKKLPF